MPAFTLCTWNILATSYIRPAFYPDTPAHVLDPQWRVPALVQRILDLNADIYCLQEVESSTFLAIDQALGPCGYRGTLAMKAGRKPDGCATFFRSSICTAVADTRLEYADAPDVRRRSGHIAQITTIEVHHTPVTVVNTHLKWDPPETPRESQWGYRQILLVLAALDSRPAPSPIDIICGDFNATPEAPLITALLDAGFQYTHRNAPGVFTCNSNRQPKRIDYIFYRGPVEERTFPVPAIDARTPLPSSDEPSDHLPLAAEFFIS